MTRRQQIMFRSGDADEDGFQSHEEVVAAMSYRQFHSYLGRLAALRARVFDLDANGKYDETEFGLVYGVKAGEPLPPAIGEKFRGKSFGAGNHDYYNMMMRIVHMPLEDMAELNERIDAFKRAGGRESALRKMSKAGQH